MNDTQQERKEALDKIDEHNPYVTQYTPEIICPYCGHEHGDSWEYGGGGEDTDTAICDECDREFEWSRFIITEYSTKRIGGDE